MSSKDKPEVVRRLRRGRSAPDSKNKTDSGCFVDEELEKNGSSDSSSGSLNSSPLREEEARKGPQSTKESAGGTIKRSVPIKPSTVHGNSGKSHDGGGREKEAMNEEVQNLLNTCEESKIVTEKSNAPCDVEKSRRASDFYCLYYSGSPESTLTRADKNKVKGKPPVPPKPKQRRSSAPPASFNNAEKIQWRNREAGKHLSHNRFKDNRPKSDTIVELFQESEKMKTIGERIVYFESCSRSNEFGIENTACNSVSDVRDTEKNCGSKIAEREADVRNDREGAPIVNEEDFSFELGSQSHSFKNDASLQEEVVPLVEPEESLVDDSIRLSEGNFSLAKQCLESVHEVDETFALHDIRHPDFLDLPLVDKEQNGVNFAVSKGASCYDAVECTETARRIEERMQEERENSGVATENRFSCSSEHSTERRKYNENAQNENEYNSAVLQNGYGSFRDSPGLAIERSGKESTWNESEYNSAVLQNSVGSFSHSPGLAVERREKECTQNQSEYNSGVLQNGFECLSSEYPDLATERTMKKNSLKEGQCMNAVTQNGFEMFDGLDELDTQEQEEDTLKVSRSSGEIVSDQHVPRDYRNYKPCPESREIKDLRDYVLNSRLDEIKQELLKDSRYSEGKTNRRRPGSICGLSHQEKDISSQMKRRSWSVCDPKPKDSESPFVRKVYQIPASKLTTSSWRSDSGLSSPFVRTFHSNVAKQNSLPDVAGMVSKSTSHRKVGRCHADRFETSGYASDDSSVHSEPLFQPLKRKPQRLNNPNFSRSVSDESRIAELSCTESEDSTKVPRKRLRHPTGSTDPLNALRRQSDEFAAEQQLPPFRPISPVHVPRLQTLRRSSSNTSSSSDSEVEKIFNPTNNPAANSGIHDGIVAAVNNRKVSAMEALFGPQSPQCSTLSSDCNVSRRKTLSERFSEEPAELAEPEHSSDEVGLEPLEVEEFLEEVEESGLKGVEEPGLEFDDTDYSEFYTLCEDKETLITAEALSIKKLLQSPQTVLPDPESIESVVLSATERKVVSPDSSKADEEYESVEATSSRFSLDQMLADELLDEETAAEIEALALLERRNRGTQTPPPEVFRALSPPPSVGTQTPPISLVEELSTSLRGVHVPPNPSSERSLSPPPRERQVVPLEHFGAVPPSVAPFFEPDIPQSLKDSDKAISVEELLHILANMGCQQPVPTATATPQPRRKVSIQRYNSSSNMAASTGKIPQSLPSSWQHLSRSSGKHASSTNVKSSSQLQRSSKSHDCIRQSLAKREMKRNAVIQAKMVGFTDSSENIRRKLRDWKLRSRLFEEEVECMEDKGAKDERARVKEETALKVSFDGSESTDTIETPSKLTKTHSLKRPRKDRAFSHKDRNGIETNADSDQRSCFSHSSKSSNSAAGEGSNQNVNKTSYADSFIGTEEGQFDATSDTLLAESFAIEQGSSDRTEVDTPGSFNVFIDYRKKNGRHITCTSTPKPPPDPDEPVFPKEVGLGKVVVDRPGKAQAEKLVGSAAEDSQADVESQGDASSSSYSSDDDAFGDFGGSTETVVFVDTEPSADISYTPDSTFESETLDLKLGKLPDEIQSLLKDEGDKGNDSSLDTSLDALLGQARKSLDLEFLDSNILDKAIERFKQRVSPKSQNNARPPSSGLSMEAYVALHQADELQGIIGEIKGELKLLQDENVMLREQVESLASHQTAGEVTENSSTESSERLEHVYKLSKAWHGDPDEEEQVDVDVCLRGFSTAPLPRIPSKKKDILLGTVSVKGADWNGVIEAARKTFVEHMRKIDPDNYLCLGAHSIQGVQTGVIVWSPGSLRRTSPRVELSKKSNPCIVELKDGSHFSCDSLVYDTLIPKEVIEKYVEQLLEHRCIVLCGQQGLGKSYLAAKLGEHLVQRIGWKRSPAVVTYNVAQTTRKELKQELFSLLQHNITSPRDGTPAVIILDQLNCLASLSDIFELSQMEGNKTCPYIIGVRDKSRKGPFSSKELGLSQLFRWLRVSVHDRQYAGLLGRFLRRKLSWSEVQNDEEVGQLLGLFDWLSKVWYHLNEILEDYCEPDAAIGPSLFFSCPMNFNAAEGWFGTVWNYYVVPYLHQALRAGRKIFSRCIRWEDPTKWVVLRYPWNKDHSRVLPALRKLRQVDIVLNRNQLGSDSVSFAECIEDNERILRAHSTMSKRVRAVVHEQVPKGQLIAKRKVAEGKEHHRDDEDKDSCYSDTDSYLETSI